MTRNLSPLDTRRILFDLSAFSLESALRQIDIHEQRGHFTATDCAVLRDAIKRSTWGPA